jgi:hypothetical protein
LGRQEKMLGHGVSLTAYVSYVTLAMGLVNEKGVGYGRFRPGVTPMRPAMTEADLADRASRFLKAELKRANVTYGELARRLGRYGLREETPDSIKSKLKRGTFPATFFVAALAAIGLEGIRLEDV